MTALLTPDDLLALTHKRQPAAQIRELRRMGLQPLVRADGTPAITWEAVNARMQGQAADQFAGLPESGLAYGHGASPQARQRTSEPALTAGECVMSYIPQLRALLDALPTVEDSLTVAHPDNARDDAKRYRFVRKLYWFAQNVSHRFGVPEPKTLEELDVALDRAMGGAP